MIRKAWASRMDRARLARFSAACVLLLVLSLLLHQRTQDAKWPYVQGTIRDTRIVADHALETKRGGQLIYRAEYRVAYSVGSQEREVWADSGIRRESEADVRVDLPRRAPSCMVQYNPKKPEESIADCR